MNIKQTNNLKLSISKYLDTEYKNIPNIQHDSDFEYLELFDKILKNVENPLKTMFILPNGKLKRFELDLSNYNINDIYKINFNITNDNIYDYVDLDHVEIKYLGFDLDEVLKAGCMRISNNLDKKELDIGMNLFYNKPTDKMLKTIDELLVYYNTVLVDFFADRNGKEYIISDETIKQLKKDINKIYNSLHKAKLIQDEFLIDNT